MSEKPDAPSTEVARVDHVSKKYCRSLRRSMFYALQDISYDLVGYRPRNPSLRADEFWSVDDISFAAHRGECLGVIGPNGSGKSTLLKLLSGIILPDRGVVTVTGRTCALIEVGAGFHPMLTGAENIYTNASILGLKKKEIDRKYEAIVEFAELQEFIDTPVKYYSSGMYVRLGFSIAAHIEPDILLVDEILAVGDSAFRRKSFQHMKNYLDKGGTILLVTHDMRSLNSICDRAIVLSRGGLCYEGTPGEAAQHYQKAATAAAPDPLHLARLHDAEMRYGSHEAELTQLELLARDTGGGTDDQEILSMLSGEPVIARLTVRAHQSVEISHVGLTMWETSGQLITNMNTQRHHKPLPPLKAGEEARVEFRFICPFGRGRYRVGAGLFCPVRNDFLDRRLNWKTLIVTSPHQGDALIHLPFEVDIRGNTSGEAP